MIVPPAQGKGHTGCCLGAKCQNGEAREFDFFRWCCWLFCWRNYWPSVENRLLVTITNIMHKLKSVTCGNMVESTLPAIMVWYMTCSIGSSAVSSQIYLVFRKTLLHLSVLKWIRKHEMQDDLFSSLTVSFSLCALTNSFQIYAAVLSFTGKTVSEPETSTELVFVCLLMQAKIEIRPHARWILIAFRLWATYAYINEYGNAWLALLLYLPMCQLSGSLPGSSVNTFIIMLETGGNVARTFILF